MSVRGEYRRIGGDLLATLRDAGSDDPVALAPCLERAAEDLPGAAEATLELLPALSGARPADPDLARRFDDAYERLESVCRIILGR